MAVIRSRRLWTSLLLPGLRDPDHPEVVPRAQQTVYTVPAGYRAIIRTMTAALDTVSGGSAITPHVNFALYPNSGQIAIVAWLPFISRQPNLAEWVPGRVWNGMLVLHQGDSMRVNTVDLNAAVYTQASGHLLPETV